MVRKALETRGIEGSMFYISCFVYGFTIVVCWGGYAWLDLCFLIWIIL
jgi:hypothetical protein